MNPLFKKLNYKDQKEIVILNAPAGLKPVMDEMANVTTLSQKLPKEKKLHFVLAFVTKQSEVDELAHRIGETLEGDGIVWFAYPKGTSKKYKCEFNRDTGWQTLGSLGFEGVRMVAVDEDWSALRFRKAEYIKSMTRSFAMSDEGKRKATSSKSKGNRTK